MSKNRKIAWIMVLVGILEPVLNHYAGNFGAAIGGMVLGYCAMSID